MTRSEKHESDEIRDLLVEAGPPEPIPPADLAAIRNAARRAFAARSGSPILEGQSVSPIVEGRSWRQPLMAIAATLILVLTAVWLFRTGGAPIATTTVATVELLRGDGASGLEIGQEIAAGREIDTASERPLKVALRMASGHSVRLDANSKVRFTGEAAIELERGTIYVDSGPLGATTGLEIATPHGTVREVGTQYEVRLSDNSHGSMRVRVREGSIALSRAGEVFSASRGEELTVDQAGVVDRGAIADADWGWVIASAPPFDADGRTLEAYLAWFSRETGLEIDYSDPRLELDAATITLSSSARRDLTPEQTLGNYLPGAMLDYRIEDGRLVVSRPAAN